MSIPISGAAALGVAKLATHAVSQSIQGSAAIASSFAEVLGETLSDDASETAAPKTEQPQATAAETAAAKSSLRQLLSDWMQHFGLSSNQPIEIRMDPTSDSLRIQAESNSPDTSRKVLDLQNRINSDDALRRTISDSLQQLPDGRFTMSSSQPTA